MLTHQKIHSVLFYWVIKAFFILVFLVIFLMWHSILVAQDFVFGVPEIHFHSKDSYDAGNQNWDIDFQNGVVYFANNAGLLSYDGCEWNSFQTPSNTIMRSIKPYNGNKVLIGSQNEIGYFGFENDMLTYYVDLKERLRGKAIELNEIWDINNQGDSIWFSTEQYVNCLIGPELMQYGGDHMDIEYMSVIDDSVWFHDMHTGLYVIDQESKFITGSEIFKGLRIQKIINTANKIYVFTQENGAFVYDGNTFLPWKTDNDAFLIRNRINCVDYSEQYGFFIGTYFGGVVQFSELGKSKMYLDKDIGLRTNNINCIALAPNDVLWIGSSRGLDEVDLSSRFRKFYPDNKLEGAVYDAELWNDNIYFSTSNGLYYINQKDFYAHNENGNFQLVDGTNGLTWGTDIIDGQLYCAHHEGPFLIMKDNSSVKLSEEKGIWKFIKLNDTEVAIGSYTGVSLYQYNGKPKLEFDRKIDDFKESSRFMVADKFNNLWVSHPYKNVYKIGIGKEKGGDVVEVFNGNSGFELDDNNYIFNINNICHLTNSSGVYHYNEIGNTFEPSTTLNQFFDEGNRARRLLQYNDEIWCISDDFTSLISHTGKGIDFEFSNEIKQGIISDRHYIGGFEQLLPLDKNTLLLLSDEGAWEYKMKSNKQYIDKPIIKSLKVNSKEIYNHNTNDKPVSSVFKPENNTIHFNYNTEYPNTNQAIQYSVKLDGLDDKWSEWTTQNFKEFVHLPYGTYEFKVKSKTENKHVFESEGYAFEIETPWHAGWIGKLLMTLLFIGLIVALLVIPRQKYNENKAILEKEKEEVQEEIEQIKQENLLKEIKLKNHELASSTLLLVQKNQTINTLRNKFDELNEIIKNPTVKRELRKIVSIFRDDLNLEEDWDKFGLYFDQVHRDFNRKLKSRYPNLTTKDHKLCAYLKMNLTTKEIAPLLNISVRGVEISRYRLRKKLDLDRNINLNQFFNDEFE